jgi:hypothetical protein
VHLLVLGRGDEARGGFRLIDRPLAVDFSAARLRFRPRAQRLRGALGMVEAAAVAVNGVAVVVSEKPVMQHRVPIVGPGWLGTHW